MKRVLSKDKYLEQTDIKKPFSLYIKFCLYKIYIHRNRQKNYVFINKNYKNQ